MFLCTSRIVAVRLRHDTLTALTASLAHAFEVPRALVVVSTTSLIAEVPLPPLFKRVDVARDFLPALITKDFDHSGVS